VINIGAKKRYILEVEGVYLSSFLARLVIYLSGLKTLTT